MAENHLQFQSANSWFLFLFLKYDSRRRRCPHMSAFCLRPRRLVLAQLNYYTISTIGFVGFYNSWAGALCQGEADDGARMQERWPSRESQKEKEFVGAPSD
jgi:hypothetical protein